MDRTNGLGFRGRIEGGLDKDDVVGLGEIQAVGAAMERQAQNALSASLAELVNLRLHLSRKR